MAVDPDDLDHAIRSDGDPRLLRAVAVLVLELELIRAAPDQARVRFLGSLGLTPNQTKFVLERLGRLKDLPLKKIDRVSVDPHGMCPITWQPSISKPVFYGYRDFGPADGAPTDARVFYPSLEGSPIDAPMLTGCGHYPLILFLHGHCQTDNDHYLSWYRLPAQLARSGYIVAVPRLAGIAGGTAPWTEPNDDLMTAHDTHVWIRDHPEITVHLAPFPQTGIIGHSYGAMLGARLANYAPCFAYASLSAGWNDWISGGEPIPLSELSVPSLSMWGGYLTLKRSWKAQCSSFGTEFRLPNTKSHSRTLATGITSWRTRHRASSPLGHARLRIPSQLILRPHSSQSTCLPKNGLL